MTRRRYRPEAIDTWVRIGQGEWHLGEAFGRTVETVCGQTLAQTQIMRKLAGHWPEGTCGKCREIMWATRRRIDWNDREAKRSLSPAERALMDALG